jgi:hypothetical protein
VDAVPRVLDSICSFRERSGLGEKCVLHEHPEATIDILNHPRGDFLISVLGKADAWQCCDIARSTGQSVRKGGSPTDVYS